MNNETNDRPKKRPILVIVLAVIAVGVVLTAGVAARMSRSTALVSEMPTFTVRQGRLLRFSSAGITRYIRNRQGV